VVAHDEATAWVWLPLREDGRVELDMIETVLAASGKGVRVAVGEPGAGLDGFRRTHQQALRVHSLALVAKGNEEPALWFRMIGPIALMADDLPAARVWVGQTLGGLALDDESTQRLRETLLAFLTAGSSHTAAAAALTLHKNSVQYRVRRAEVLLGHPVAENRFNVETALSLCRWLG
jgi:DNA-binding PucR family transcriptional regulator